ncbi:hypothetical protein [Aliiruegeria lutimaris]|uniref:Uncharacterized protein n=1 Tax=Aliiruegeria lutimaris TaxID=571298 RepID=A0A1G9L6N7_9RHOB|nr:hypothetical protein [Aliiruegeria lutimaris]SDL57611.1 hypothetical protein SAMN04488026_10953 [Aliiruegeria lutimaris]
MAILYFAAVGIAAIAALMIGAQRIHHPRQTADEDPYLRYRRDLADRVDLDRDTRLSRKETGMQKLLLTLTLALIASPTFARGWEPGQFSGPAWVGVIFIAVVIYSVWNSSKEEKRNLHNHFVDECWKLSTKKKFTDADRRRLQEISDKYGISTMTPKK